MEKRSDLLQEIKNHLNTLPEGRIYALPTGEDAPSWVLKLPSCYGVAVPWNQEDTFYAAFHHVEIEALSISYQGKQQRMLCLYVTSVNGKNDVFLPEFASLCCDFVQPGEHGENRQLVISHPDIWWNRWRILMGNASSSLPVHAVVAEMIFYRYLLRQGRKPVWTADDHKRLDFTTEDHAWEVKATLSRSRNDVTIHGQYQMQSPPDCVLDLIFCRMEEGQQGDSVDSLAIDLVALGVNSGELESSLRRLGLRSGAIQRKRKYTLLEMSRFPVDDNFPKITDTSFVGGKMPNGILRMEYTVDLSNLKHESLLKG